MAEKRNKNKLTEFGLAVKVALVRKDMTAKDLAAMIGVKNTYISRILHGIRRGEKYREQITGILGINLCDFDSAGDKFRQ